MFRLVYDNAGGRTMGNAINIPVTSGERYQMGEALVITGGKATKGGASVKPTHMCARDQAPDSAEYVLVYPISGTMVFETTFAADPAALSVGAKVTLSTDGLGITATTTNGVCEIVDVREKVTGGHVLVKF